MIVSSGRPLPELRSVGWAQENVHDSGTFGSEYNTVTLQSQLHTLSPYRPSQAAPHYVQFGPSAYTTAIPIDRAGKLAPPGQSASFDQQIPAAGIVLADALSEFLVSTSSSLASPDMCLEQRSLATWETAETLVHLAEHAF